MDEITKELAGKAVEGVALEIYKDFAKPTVKSLGEVLSFLPRSIRLLLSGWEKWLINGEESLMLTASAIREKIETIPTENIVEPEPYVAIPAIQQISYCQDNEVLRGLYANLLVSSMNAETKWSVHPAFVDIIKQLTPDEARIIDCVGGFKNNFLPLLDVKGIFKERDSTGHQLLITNFTTVGFDAIENKESICSYIDNLVRLNLFEIPPTYHLVDPQKYDPLLHNPVLERMVAAYRPVFDIDYNYKVLVITNLGLSFKRICCDG